MVNAEHRPRAHDYAQAVAVTGRLSTQRSQPAEHPDPHRRGPAHPRGVHRAAGHVIVSADYSQIELRIMAHLSDDAGLLAGVSRRARTSTARRPREVFGVPPAEVDAASSAATPRSINFGLIYGMSAFGLAQQPRHRARRRRSSYIDSYFARYPGVARLHGAHARARRASRATSRRCSAAGCGCPTSTPAAARAAPAPSAQAINAPMQGTAADLIKLAMIAVQRLARARAARDASSSCRCTTSWCSKCPTASSSACKRELPGAHDRRRDARVPLVVDVGAGPNWDQAH